ncbi:hypothetical protein C8F01DRAFT_973856 [Mycena amicta]|nr:hypothetical protein C8F01DRAFT_973856 [Mycena amicta]
MDLSFGSAPAVVWRFYVDSLWKSTEHPNSWISQIAYVCRILAILLIIPVLVLILLDIASYGIARTLGVIDVTAASTSDKKTIHNNHLPLVEVYQPTTPLPDSPTTDPDAYFTAEPNSLKLAGVGVFSPAASRPPSPTITRKALPPEDKRIDVEEEGIVFTTRKRAARKAQGLDEDEHSQP